DVIFKAALGAGKDVGFSWPPGFQAVEQRHADLLPTLGAASLLKKPLRRYVDAAASDNFQPVMGLAVRQKIRTLCNTPGSRPDGIGHAVTTLATSGRQLLDDLALDQPAQQGPSFGFMGRQGGYPRDEDQLRGHNEAGLRQMEGGQLRPCGEQIKSDHSERLRSRPIAALLYPTCPQHVIGPVKGNGVRQKEQNQTDVQQQCFE